MNAIAVFETMTSIINYFANIFWLGVFSIFYLVPIVSILRIKVSSRFMLRLNELIGTINKYFYFIRFVLDIFILCIFSTNLAFNYSANGIVFISFGILLIASDLLDRKTKWAKISKFIPLIKSTIAPEPQKILRMLDASSGPFFPTYTKPLNEIVIKNADFRKSKINTCLAVKRGLFSTIRFAKFVSNVSKKIGHDTAKSIAQQIMVAWSLSIIKECGSAIILKRPEFINDINGRMVYVFTHSSFLDFVVAPLVSAFRKQSGIESNIPVFLLAKDHFWHNPIYRHVLGIGKAAKALDMIFVSRKGKSEDARFAVEQAVKAVESGKDIIIFPQGSRSIGRHDKFGNRVEAGYYAVGSPERMSKESSHLKKGVAYIGFELAGLKEPVCFIPIAIKGTSIICPKHSRKIKPNQFIEFVFGSPIYTKDMSEEDVDGWLREIDKELRFALGVNSFIERWFLEDMRRVLQPYELEELSLALKPWRDNDTLVYSILDIIYCLKPETRLMHLSELAKLILNDSDRNTFLNFKKKTAQAIKKPR